ncbi:MAG: DUF4838 domain-containing protein [Kiritimatiellae bacterium]|nr:DUF4838 domain-containing protein [Kiritimatiellia bacterium]
MTRTTVCLAFCIAVSCATHGAWARGALCLTFDDRNFDAWEKNIPLFAKYGAHATFFVCGPIDARAEECLRSLSAAGHSIGLHGFGHRRAPDLLAKLGEEGFVREEILPQLSVCRAKGLPVRSYAYPFSSRTPQTDALLLRHFGRLRAGWGGDSTPRTMDEVSGMRVLVGMCGTHPDDVPKKIADMMPMLAASNSVLVAYAHSIEPDGARHDNHHMRRADLEAILAAAKAAGVGIVGFDELPGTPPAPRLSDRVAWSVVRPDSAGGFIQKYSRYVASILGETTGSQVPCVKESAWKGVGRAVFIGDTAKARAEGLSSSGMPYEEYAVKSVGEHVVVVGSGVTGTVYAMFEFLSRGLGVEHFDPWNRHVPSVPDPDLRHLDIRRAPDFLYRHIFDLSGWTDGPFEYRAALKASECRLPNPIFGSPGTIHTFHDYQKDWPADRTDWLAKDEGGAPRKLTGKLGPCFCMTNPDARADFRRKFVAFIASDEEDKRKFGIHPPFIYNVSQNDAAEYFCKCPRCMAVETRAGASGLLLDFINGLAAAVPASRPDILVSTAAYSFTEKPPLDDTRAADNVMVELSHTKGNYYVPVESDTTSVFRAYLDGWSRKAKNLSVWDYWIFYWDSFPSVYHNIERIPRDIRYYKSRGVRSLRFESEAADTASFFALKNWLGFRMMDNTGDDPAALVESFFTHYYGAAGAEMRELMEYIALRQKGQYASVFDIGHKQYEVPPRPWLDREFFARCDDIFSRAEAKVASDAHARLNVRRERIPVDISLMRMYDSISPSVSRDALAARYSAAAEAFARERERPDRLNGKLMKIKAEADRCRKADEIRRVASAPLPRLRIPRSPEKATCREWYDNNGFRTDRRLSVSASVDDSGVLEIGLQDEDIADARLVAGRHIWDGDEWEVFLMDARNDYLQVLVDPNGRFEVFTSIGGVQRAVPPDGVSVASERSGGTWRVRLRFAADGLPVGKAVRGDFFRSTATCKYAWAPTGADNFRLKHKFGWFELSDSRTKENKDKP